MKSPLFIVLLSFLFYLPAKGMDLQKAAWYGKATLYSTVSLSSTVIIIYSCIEAAHRQPLDTYTGIIAGIAGTRYFAELAYKNAMQAWTGQPKALSPDKKEIITKETHKAVTDLANKITNGELNITADIPSNDPRAQPATIRIQKAQHTEMETNFSTFLQQQNEKTT